MDFVWRRAGAAVGIEVKATARWRPEFARPLSDLHAAGTIASAWGVYLGERRFQNGAVTVVPLTEFLSAPAAGKVLRPPRAAARLASKPRF